MQNLLREINNLLEDFEQDIEGKYNLDQAYYIIPLSVAIETLKEDLEILDQLNIDEANKLVWYSIHNFQQTDNFEPLGILNERITNILTSIKRILNNIKGSSINNSYPQQLTKLILHLNTIIKNFRFDLDVRTLKGVRSKYNQAKQLLEKAQEIVEKLKQKEEEIKNINSDIENLINQKEKVEELHSKTSEINDRLSNIDEFLEELEVKQEEINNLYEKTEELKNNIDELNESFQKRIGKYESDIEKFKQEKKATLLDLNEKFETKFQKLEDYEEKQKKILEDLIQRAQNALEWTTASGLKTAFSEKTEKLEKEAKKYFHLFLLSVTLAFIIIYSAIFCPELILKLIPWIKITNSVNHISENFWLLILTRIGIIGPLLFFVYLMWKTFIKTKLLQEEYEKKAILAQNLMIGANTLTENLGFSKEEITEMYIRPSIEKMLEDSVEKVHKLHLQEIEYENIFKKFKQSLTTKNNSEQSQKNELKDE